MEMCIHLHPYNANKHKKWEFPGYKAIFDTKHKTREMIEF